MDLRRMPRTVYPQRTGGVDISTISLRPSEYADACEPAGTFVDGLDILAKYKVEHTRITFAAGERNALILFDCSSGEDLEALLEAPWPSGWFFQGTSGDFILSETLNELPVLQDKIYQNVFGTCIRRQDLAHISPKTIRYNQFAHDIVLTLETFPKTATLEVSIDAIPCPPMPSLVTVSETGNLLRILDEYGIVRAELPGPAGTHVFRDFDITAASIHTAFQMLYPAKEIPAPVSEDSTAVLFHNVYLENIAPWEILDVSVWRKAVDICIVHFEDKSGIKVGDYLVGVHKDSGRAFQSSTKRIDGHLYTIFSVDLSSTEKTQTYYHEYVHGMKKLLDFFKSVSFEIVAQQDLDAFYTRATAKPKRHLVDDDQSSDSEDDFVHRPVKRKSMTKDSYIATLKKRFKSFARVGGRGGIKRGADFVRRRKEILDENIDKERETALKYMTEDEYDTLMERLTDSYGY